MERDPTKFQAIPEDFIITAPKIEKSTDAEAWEILGRPLEKARKYITDPSKAPEGVKVQRGKKGGYYYDAAPVRTSLKAQPEKIQAAVKDLFAEGMDAKMITTELEEKHGVKVHPETVNRFLEREGVETTRVPRKTVSRKDVAEREQTISEQSKQIEDMGGEIDTLKDDVKFYKDKYTALDQKNTEMSLQIANLRAAVDALKMPVSEETSEEVKKKITKTVTDYETKIRDQDYESRTVKKTGSGLQKTIR
jgi:transposase